MDEDLIVYNDDDYVEFLDIGEAASVEEVYTHLAEVESDPGIKAGPFTLHTGTPVPLPTGFPVDQVRRAVAHDLRQIMGSDETGAWLVRHPPGTGKTTAYAAIVQSHDLPYERPTIGCAPTVSEAEALSEKTGIPMLRSQSPLNCRQMAEEREMPKDKRRLARHLALGHVGSEFCDSCRFKPECSAIPGNYRKEQAEFVAKVTRINGHPQYITTTKMLEHLAPALLKSPSRVIVWTDEDLFPHLRTEVPALTAEHLTSWIFHAQMVGICPPEDMAFMTAVADMILREKPKGEKSPNIKEDHETEHGRRILVTDEVKAPILELLAAIEATESRTHATEKTSPDGDALEPGMWHRAIFSQVVALLHGIAWINIEKGDKRSLVGYAINRDLHQLPTKHCLLQSDATATKAVWGGIWGKNFRRVLDGSPKRAVKVDWWPAIVPQSSENAYEGALLRVLNVLKDNPGRIGVLTFKQWSYKLRHALVTRGHTVHMLPHKDATGEIIGVRIGGPIESRIVLGHFGAHDRGINDYHMADLSAFMVLGSYRPPMAAMHARAAVLSRLGVTFPDLPGKPVNRLFPAGSDGTVISQDANRAMKSEDKATNWVCDYERGAHLAQSLERIRSVDRAARGMPPIQVYLYGPEACRPIIPLPIRYSVA